MSSFARSGRTCRNWASPGCRGIIFPDMPCMKRAYRVKRSVGPLVSSQEQKALLVPVINCFSTAYQPFVYCPLCSSIDSNKISFVRASGKTFRRRLVFSMPGGVRGMLVSWAKCFVGGSFCPAPPRRPAVCLDPIRLWLRMFGLSNRQV